MSATAATPASPAEFVAAVEPPARREEAQQLLSLLADATGAEPFMSGTSIVGFGRYTYRYPSGRAGETMRVGFSPRKAALSIYGLKDVPELAPMLARVGPHTEGAGCVYVKRLADLDLDVLRELAAAAFAAPREHEVTQ